MKNLVALSAYSPNRELNSGPPVYKTGALPLSYQGINQLLEKVEQNLTQNAYIQSSVKLRKCFAPLFPKVDGEGL